ncbi:MAG: IS630 family transposase [Planctomycetota bacterium]
MAAEQNRPDVAGRRRNHMIAARFVDPGSLVFLDETGARTNMTRLYGRSAVGERCVDHTPHGHWKTMTLLSAMRLDGVMRDATVVYDGPMNRDTFVAYVEHELAPALRPGDVVVMDNLSSHKDPAVRGLIESAGADLWYLPAYSPDLNPIEKLWSKAKAWLRRVMAHTFEGVVAAIAQALSAADSTECAAYFRACGYGQ